MMLLQSLKLMLQAVLAPSQVMPENADTVQGWDFGHGCSLDELLGSFIRTGFQATAFGRAVNEVNRMVGPSYPSASYLSVPHTCNRLMQGLSGFMRSENFVSCCSWTGVSVMSQ